MARLMALIQPRIEKFSQIPGQISFFEALPEFDCELFVNKGQKATLENTILILPAAIDILNSVQPWKSETLFENLKKLSADLGLKAGSVMWAVRIAISGTSATPGGATDILEILGQQESLRRLSFSLDKVKAHLA
jgi:glutamyl-tRNA synthetase